MRALGVGLVTAVAIGFGATYSDHAALLPLLAADLGLSDAQAGLLSAALFVAYIATTLLTSGVPDRIGPKRAIGVGLAVSIAGTAIFAAGNGFPVLLAAKAVQGVGSALAFVPPRGTSPVSSGRLSHTSHSVSTAPAFRSDPRSRFLRRRPSPPRSAAGAHRSDSRRSRSRRSWASGSLRRRSEARAARGACSTPCAARIAGSS